MMIETGIVRDLAAAPVPENLVALRHHLAREDAARKSGERSELIRLSGEFHVALANAQGNSVLIKTMRELVTRGSLIVGMFGVNRGETCPEDEHSLILDAISSGDGDSAARLIRHHLSHIQAGLDLRQPKGKDDDLASILGG
jgi:DNA-binding GntR family transcriptional regulator